MLNKNKCGGVAISLNNFYDVVEINKSIREEFLLKNLKFLFLTLSEISLTGITATIFIKT